MTAKNPRPPEDSIPRKRCMLYVCRPMYCYLILGESLFFRTFTANLVSVLVESFYSILSLLNPTIILSKNLERLLVAIIFEVLRLQKYLHEK